MAIKRQRQRHYIGSLFVLFGLVFLLASLYAFIFEVEYNKCDMTYMMQYPDYIPVKLPPSVQRKFPQYSLFVYTEGHSEPVRRGIYEGTPLLFIPGNDGSHKQVRSLASVAIQMRKSLRTEARFDCFAVDLNSEFSALHGPFLYRQSEFVQHVVDHIESLYPSRARFSIILVGHSMGGLVARHAMTLDSFDKGRVPLIVTLATPHQRPVLNTDGHMSRFYAELNGYWRAHRATSLGHVALVSIGGGDRDIEVALGLTRPDGLALPRNSLWASAGHVRDAWASTDHRCIVWCKQLVIALCRALFAVNASGGFVGAGGGGGGAAAIVAEFGRRLLPSVPSLSAPAPATPPAAAAAPSKAADPSRWFYRDLSDPRQRAFRFERDRLIGPLFVKVVAPAGRELLAPGESAVFVLDGSDAGGGGEVGWLFACLDPPPADEAARHAPCQAMTRLDAAHGRDLPPSGLRRRLARVDADDARAGAWRNATAFVAVLGPASEQTELHFDLRPASSRSLRLDPWRPWASLAAAGAAPSDLRLPAGSLYYAVLVSAPLGRSGRGLEVTLAAHNCRALVGSPGCLAQEAAGASGGGYTHAVQYFNQNASLPLADCGGGGCLLHVVVNPLCEHSLSVRFRPQLFGAALLRETGDSLPTWAALQVLSALLSSLVVQPHQHQPASLYSSLTGSPIPLLTGAIACLPVAISGGLGGLARQLCAACLALPFAAALLLSVAAVAAWLGLLMRAPRLLLPGRFAVNFANFLSPFGCILALYLTQCHCAAAGIAFLLVTQLLKTAAARLSSTNQKETAAGDATVIGGDSGKPPATTAEAEAVAAEARILTHHSALAAVCALLTCLCGPSLFVWAKALQQQAASGGDSDGSELPVADPHYPLGVAFAVLYAADSALLAGSRIRAPPLDLSWPVAVCVSVLLGSVASQCHGNFTAHGYAILLLLAAYTLARGARATLGEGQRPKLD